MKTQSDSNIHIGGRQAVNPQEVVMLQAEINYTVLFFVDGKKTIVATTLKTLESRFVPFNFFRTHKSYLVNLGCVQSFGETKNTIQMTDNHSVMVSRRKMEGLKMNLKMIR